MSYRIFFSTIITCFLVFSLAAQTSLEGKVTDAETGEPILFGTVALYQNGTLIIGVETDFDGNYHIDSLTAGVYDVDFYYVGLAVSQITDF